MSVSSFKTSQNEQGYSVFQKHTDVLQATIGDFGKWQFEISILMALIKIPIAWFHMGIVFLAPPVDFRCKNGSDSLENVSMILNKSDNCDDGYEFNTTVFSKTIISEWNLVLTDKNLVDLSQVILMFGVLIGNIFFGILADRKGRKPVLMCCIFLQSIFGIIASWIPWFWGFIFARFLLGFANGGTMVISFVICVEIVGGKWRTIVPILYQIPFGLGTTLMAVISYYLRDWRDFHFTISLLSTLFLFYFWLIPESPRWLLAIGKRTSAMSILNKAAQTNKRDTVNFDEIMTELSNVPTRENKASVSALFSTPELRKRSTLLYTSWVLSGLTFYAFSQYLGQVSQNIFFTVAIGGLTAVPGTILCVFLVGRSGRKNTIVYSQFITALCLLSIVFVPKGYFVKDWPILVCSGFGIIGFSVSMPALYLFTGELYPTVLRNAGVGTSVMFMRLGSMTAPFVISLKHVAAFLPLLILGVAAFLGGFLVLPLPETIGKPLPDTVEDLGGKGVNKIAKRELEDLNMEKIDLTI